MAPAALRCSCYGVCCPAGPAAMASAALRVQALCGSHESGSSVRSWLPATTILRACGCALSQAQKASSSCGRPVSVKSPAWIRQSPAGSGCRGAALCVSLTQTNRTVPGGCGPGCCIGPSGSGRASSLTLSTWRRRWEVRVAVTVAGSTVAEVRVVVWGGGGGRGGGEGDGPPTHASARACGCSAASAAARQTSGCGTASRLPGRRAKFAGFGLCIFRFPAAARWRLLAVVGARHPRPPARRWAAERRHPSPRPPARVRARPRGCWRGAGVAAGAPVHPGVVRGARAAAGL